MTRDRCVSCNAPIRWLRTNTGKWIAVDDETYEPKDKDKFIYGKHRAHRASCPRADKHRKK